MKKLLLIIAILGTMLAACVGNDTTTWEEYKDWRELNQSWLEEMQAKTDDNGDPYYKVVVPSWNPAAYVLIHYFNDRSETEGNLSPLYTSTVDVRYNLYDCEGDTIDSSDSNTTYGAGISRLKLSSTIEGWAIAMEDMRCGDTVEVVVPYASAYGSTATSSIYPYSNLRFNIRLVDIPFYETTY
jgi:FKBP-type peptidyl-prolyl cis-trans isomerase FklB